MYFVHQKSNFCVSNNFSHVPSSFNVFRSAQRQQFNSNENDNYSGRGTKIFSRGFKRLTCSKMLAEARWILKNFEKCQGISRKRNQSLKNEVPRGFLWDPRDLQVSLHVQKCAFQKMRFPDQKVHFPKKWVSQKSEFPKKCVSQKNAFQVLKKMLLRKKKCVSKNEFPKKCISAYLKKCVCAKKKCC